MKVNKSMYYAQTQQNGKEENKTCLIALFGWLDSSCCTGQTTRLLLLANLVITRQKY